MEQFDLQSEIISWLNVALAKENIENITAEIVGNSEKGDGYIGDITFVEASGETKSGATKRYDLVIKCGKRSQALRESTPVRAAFQNEIYVYTTVFPAFQKFQKEKGVQDVFDSVPKCYGVFLSDDMEVIVLQNLKTIGYDLWDKATPLTRKHLDMVLNEYGKWHAISLAMSDQDPERFRALGSGFHDVFYKLLEVSNMAKIFEGNIQEAYDLVKDELSPNVLAKWLKLRDEMPTIFQTTFKETGFFQVLSHGDCWNNNFMFSSKDEDGTVPLKVAMLDWQLSAVTSPVADLSYFIYACISKEDLKDFDQVLRTYYSSLASHAKKLGSNLEDLYSFDQLLQDWKTFSKFGVLLASLVIKIGVTEKDEVIGIDEAVDSGLGFTSVFGYVLKNKTKLKERILPIIEHLVEREFM